MCGIAGYAGDGDEASLRKMSSSIRRRGPDDEGFFSARGVGFAFRRLSIIDVAGGHQPLFNEDGSIAVMLNGEIYGFMDLRDDLLAKGHTFKTRSDTEVIVHAYEEFGTGCFEKLHGMFAIAIWDSRFRRLVVARDRMGKKPFYYSVKDGTFWFCSELKGLLAAGAISKTINRQAAYAYFRTDAVPTPDSIFQDALKLEPGSYLVWSDGKVLEREVFWKCPIMPSGEMGAAETVSILRNKIDEAVKVRLVSDVPLGLFLSGGLDSSVIAESAARQSPSKVKAFTIGFKEAEYDEREAARAVAKALGLELFEETLSIDQALNALDDATQLLDEPLADPAILPQLLLSKFTRQHVTVALSGDGGDELLLGYQHLPAHFWSNRLSFIPRPLFKVMAGALNALPAGTGYFSFGFKAQRLARGLAEKNPWLRDLEWRGAFKSTDADGLFSREAMGYLDAREVDGYLARYAAEAPAGATFSQRWSWAYLRTYLMDDVMVKVDRATMWHALESRAPLLDEQVVTHLLSLPDKFKTGKWAKKRLFKELLAGRISDDVLNRPKHGFGVPVAAWLNGPLKGLLQEVTSETFIREQGLFDPGFINKMKSEHASGRTDRRKELWALLAFQLWYRSWAL